MILFERAYSVTIGDTDITGLRVVFKAKRTLKAEPNTCDLKIYNLSDDTRKKVEAPKAKTTVRVEAGYKDKTAQIYLGQVRAAQTTVEGPDRITELTTGDGAEEIAKAQINVPIGPKQDAGKALRAMADALGVGAGNINQAISALAAKGITYLSPRGTVLTGNVSQELTDFCRSAQLEWSIQDNKLQILDLGKALEGKAVELGSDSGLLGSPTIDSKGIVSFDCLMIPEIVPGRKVVLDSVSFKGGFRVKECEYSGDSRGKEWHIKCKADRY